MTNVDSILKSRDVILSTKICIVKAMIFSSSHVCIWELEHKEDWALKNWCFWTVVLDSKGKSPLDCKMIKPVSPKANQHLIVMGWTDAETEAQILGLPDAKSWHDAGKDWGQEKKWAPQDETVGWHLWHNGHESEQTLGNREVQGSLYLLQIVRHKLATEQQQGNSFHLVNISTLKDPC